MDNLKEFLPQNGIGNAFSTISSLLTTSGRENSTTYSTSYITVMATLITKAYSLANHPQPSREELILKSKDWAAFLAPVIPENRIMEVLHVAFEGKSSSYLLSAHDMRNAWFNLIEQERAEQERVRMGQPKTHLITYRCLRCYDTGAEIVFDDYGKKLGARPGCRHQPLQPNEWIYKEEKRLDELARQQEEPKANVVAMR